MHLLLHLLLLGNNPHVSNIKAQDKQPANLQLLTSWEVVGVAVMIINYIISYRTTIIVYQMICDNSTSPIMALPLTGMLP